MTAPRFPPLFVGQTVAGNIDPFDKACVEAVKGCDAGLVVYCLSPDSLQVAMVLAPEVCLADAMAMVPVCGVGFQNALGALAPPEVAVHLEWNGNLRVNGASCGRLRVAASDNNPDEVPAWLVIGLVLPLWPENDAPGETPDRTALYAEGCADVDAVDLLEAWVKHTLVGINRWTDEGVGAVHKEWRGLAYGIGEVSEMDGISGTFLGVDERFGMLIRDEVTTHLVPLTHILEGH